MAMSMREGGEECTKLRENVGAYRHNSPWPMWEWGTPCSQEHAVTVNVTVQGRDRHRIGGGGDEGSFLLLLPLPTY